VLVALLHKIQTPFGELRLKGGGGIMVVPRKQLIKIPYLKVITSKRRWKGTQDTTIVSNRGMEQ